MRVSKWDGDFGWVVERENSEESLSDLTTDRVDALVRSGGLVLIRGFEVSPETFVSFSNQFSKSLLRHMYPDLRRNLSADGTVAEVLIGNAEVELHGEMYYRPEPRPDYLWLYCMIPAKAGGATTVCDGARLLKELKPSTRDLFLSKRVKYVHFSDPKAWRAITGAQDADEAAAILKELSGVGNVRRDSGEGIFWEFTTSAVSTSRHTGEPVFMNSIRNMIQYYNQTATASTVRVFLEDGSEIPKEALDDIRNASDRVIVPVQWKPQDMLMIDNSRCLHGRQPFEGERRIQTRFSIAA